MNFFEQLDAGGIAALAYDGVNPASGLAATIFRSYIKNFSSKLQSFKAVALVNGMPVYDLTQAPLFSQANQRVLKMGAEYQILKKPARPIAAVIAVTHACNCECRHCSARDYMQGGKKAMSYEQLINLFDQALDMGAASIVLTGGEPTLHPRLLDLVAHVPKDKASVSMFTNGAKLDTGMAKELRAAGLNAALVSVDAPDAESHDRFRGKPGAYDTAMSAIKALQASGTLVGISTYMTHNGLEAGRFEEMYQLASQLAVQQLFLFDAVPIGAMREQSGGWLTAEDRLILKQRTMRINATHGGPGVMGQSWINSPDGFGCFAGFYQCYVSASGDVMPCDFTPISFGNLQHETLDKIWQRMRQSAEWGERSQHCRMQDACFRANSVDLIPKDEPLPVTYARLQELRGLAGESVQGGCPSCGPDSHVG